MRAAWSCLLCAAVLLAAPATFAADEGDDPPEAEIKRIPINVFPNNVIIVKGKMVELENLRDYLKDLVPDPKKPSVDVLVLPNSRPEMSLAAKIVIIAREAGYTRVSLSSPKEVKPLLTEITILISRTGEILVNDVSVKEEALKEHLEKLVEAERREKVRVYVRASRLVKIKKVSDVTKICKDAGFTDVVFGLIAE